MMMLQSSKKALRELLFDRVISCSKYRQTFSTLESTIDTSSTTIDSSTTSSSSSSIPAYSFSKTNKPARVVRLLSEFGGAALRPLIQGNRYIGPLVSRKKAAKARKRALLEGTFGAFEINKGGWDPKWDTVRTFFPIKPFRGHKRERTRASRVEKVTQAMKGMPDRLAKYKQEFVDRRPKKDLMSMYKRLMERQRKRKSV